MIQERNQEMTGTPKTLRQAIRNGIWENGEERVTEDHQVFTIRRHVRDFLAQQFAIAMMNAPEAEAERLSATFKRIVGESEDGR
jgi:hypothetical protein